MRKGFDELSLNGVEVLRTPVRSERFSARSELVDVPSCARRAQSPKQGAT